MCRYLTANNTYNYIDSLNRMVSKYNITIYGAIKMKPKDVALNKNTIKVYNALYENYKPTYPFYKFDIGDKVRIVKKKKTFEKGYTPNWSEELFVIDKQLDTSPVTYSLKTLKEKISKVVFMNKNFRRVVKRYLQLRRSLNKTLRKNQHLLNGRVMMKGSIVGLNFLNQKSYKNTVRNIRINFSLL